jgi:predicted DNA-binding protein (MmcQ/YjbR family)
MDLDSLHKFCLSFQGATEHLQWEALVFKVSGKIFAVAALEPHDVWLSFKADPEVFAELTERPNVIPAPYLARAKWVALETHDAIPADELRELIHKSYDLVVAKLPRKMREKLAAAPTLKPKPKKSSARGKRRVKSAKTTRRK